MRENAAKKNRAIINALQFVIHVFSWRSKDPRMPAILQNIKKKKKKQVYSGGFKVLIKISVREWK